ncbi:copper transporter [Nocardioides jensenii]|uniref:copper transporter n=1 Tax=Nocardioides jensenii TaxID=1843 RepID=UPI00082BC11B|nr:copper transporter [Nocardioides jensenii]
MISFRYHVVSLVAVMLALAVGVALGGGPLSEIGRGSDSASEVRKDNERLTEDLEEARLVAGFQDNFGATLATSRVARSLNGRSVAVVTLPGADAKLVEALSGQVTRAGGTVSGSYALGKTLLNADEGSLVDTLGAQLAETTEDSGVQDGAATYLRMGQLIARAVGSTTPAGVAVDKGARNILSSLDSASLLSTTTGGDKRGSLVLVVLGDELTGDGLDKLLGALVTGLTNGTNGVVVAGETDSTTLSALRDDSAVTEVASSVDSVQTRAGQLATVLALAAEGDGGPGHYGVHGNDGAVPRG